MLAAMSAQHYRFVVHGELGARYAKAFEGMTVWAHDGMTDITGRVIDPCCHLVASGRILTSTEQSRWTIHEAAVRNFRAAHGP
jgi:hypothetical protein